MKRLCPWVWITVLAALAGPAAGNENANANDDLPCVACEFEKVARCGGFLEGPVFDESGRLLVVDFAGGSIFHVGKRECEEIATTGGKANGARLAPTGEVFVADAKRGILKLQDDGQTLAQVGPAITANDLIFDAEGGYYFTSPDDSDFGRPRGKLYYVSAGSGGEPRLVRDSLAFPNGVALSADGNLVYVGLFAEKVIVAIPAVASTDPVKIEYLLLRTEGGVGPDGMIVDSAGRLIWANFGDGSLGVGRNGRVVGTLRLPPEAGMLVTNVIERDGFLYVTEASKGEVWRLRLDG